MTRDGLRAAARAAIAAASAELRTVSMALHARPELAFEEEFAHGLLTRFLSDHGFRVDPGAFELSTAFQAVYGTGTPRIAVFCEYDALPGIGHACGHNLIAISGLAVALGLKAALGEGEGTVVVIGSPAEEGGGGKVYEIERGALEGVDAAVMLHPSPADVVWLRSTAIQPIVVEYFGKNAHAAGAPWEGVNALDAMLAAFHGISLLRQQMLPTDRVHGVITDGGLRPNIIPDHTAAEFFVRSEKVGRLHELLDRVRAVFEGAALATGCRLEFRLNHREYADVLTNDVMGERYVEHFRSLGGSIPGKVESLTGNVFGGFSTDMGNVSYVVPTIHPMFAIPVGDGDANHTPGFTACAATDEAHERTVRASTALAWTALDLFADPEILAGATREFRAVMG